MKWVLLLLLAGCGLFGGGKPAPRYVIGEPYRLDGVWRYPREDFALTETALAAVYERRGLTANGETFDGGALAAAHPTLQLPALARVTNLENGRQIMVRVNDRGPDSAARSLGLTRRAAELLGAAGTQGLRVRLQVMETESRGIANALRGDAAPLAVATAPRGAVQAESLTPGAPGPALKAAVAAAPPVSERAVSERAVSEAGIPQRLPEEYVQTIPRPGQLAIDCGGFSRAEYANLQRARLAGLGAYVTTDYYAPRDRAYIVRLGPYPTIAAAEAALRRALGLVPDARIVVE